MGAARFSAVSNWNLASRTNDEPVQDWGRDVDAWTESSRVQSLNANGWRGTESLRIRLLLALLLLIDITFISIHLWIWSSGDSIGGINLNLESDGSVPELFNYFKWLVSAYACVFAFLRRRDALYLIWAVLFAYFFLDDSQSIHETVGGERL